MKLGKHLPAFMIGLYKVNITYKKIIKIGIWNDYEILSVHRNNNNNLLLTGDINGKIKLFNYPVLNVKLIINRMIVDLNFGTDM